MARVSQLTVPARAGAGFPFPITLTMWHMFFCSALAFGLVSTCARTAKQSEQETDSFAEEI